MAPDDVPDGWARLNVGGKVFVTMKQTLINSPFFARLFETDDRMPDATAGSPTHFVDRVFLGGSQLLAEWNSARGQDLQPCKYVDELEFFLLEILKLRLEADFYGLENLVQLVDNVKEETELRSSAKIVTVKLTRHISETSIAVVINPRDDGHFLLRHLQQRYPCRVSAPAFVFSYGFTFDLTACPSCQSCRGLFYTSGCHWQGSHGCGCPLRNTADCTFENEVILKYVVSTLETHGYVLDPSIETAIIAAGRTPTSWTFVKRDG